MENDLKERVEKIIKDRIKGKWLFLSLTSINNSLGESASPILNEMAANGLLRKRQGVNGKLVEITKEGVQYLETV